MRRRLIQLLQILALSAGAVADGGLATRAPLLADGSFLTQVQGTLQPGQGGRGWSFRLRDAFEGEADRVIALLPSGTLEDMVRRFQSLPAGTEARFELTARVTTYRGENAALPTFAATISSFSPRPSRPVLRPPGARADAAQVAAVPEPVATPLGAAQRDEAFGMRWVPTLPSAQRAAELAVARRGEVGADDIERQLLERVGEVQRSGDLAGAPSGDERALAALSATGAIDPLSRRPWLEGERIVQERHGMVTRDPVTGEWRFVFESSRGELGEREVTLLPCDALERIERLARSTQGPLPMVLSGLVTRFEGRAYLLPASGRAPTTGRLLGR